MPKNKTHKGLMRRIKITATGKVKHKRSGGSHRMWSWSGKKVRGLKQPLFVSATVAKTMSKMLHRNVTGRSAD